MNRKENDRPGGRRPLLLIGNNRQMLNEIRDSLSHLRKQDVDGDILKTELSQSTANSLDKASAGSKMTRRDNQHHKALAEIRDSLRPYQNGSQPMGATGGGGSGACSDNSSTTSSTSESESYQSMVQQIMACGFVEDIAVKALKLTGNQSAASALAILFHIMEEKTVHKGGLPPFSQKHLGPSSPAPSETNSVRSDSPSQNFVPQRQLLVNGQTPPPLPPRMPINAQGGNHSGTQGQGQMPAYTGSEVGSKAGTSTAQMSQHPANPNFLQTLGKGQMTQQMLAHQLVGQNSHVVPQGHVQEIIQRMSPAYLLQQKQQQQQINGGGGGGGGLVGVSNQRGVSPITASNPILTQQMQNLLLGSSSASSPTPSSCPSPAPSSSSGQIQGLTRNMALPPYSQAQAQIQAARLGGMVSPAPSLESSHIPSPVLDLSGEAHQLLHKKLVTPSAVPATRRPMGSSHMPVIMPSVTSKQVQKPVPHMATAPVVSSNHVHHNGLPSSSGGAQGASQPSRTQQHHNGSPLVSGHLNGLNQGHIKSLAARKAASSQGQAGKPGDVPIQISHSYPQGLLRNGGLQFPNPEHAGQPTVHTVHAQRQYTNTPNNPPQPQHAVGVKLTNGHAPFYSQFPGDLTTPRSDSPVSRTTNQSPLSTTSSPSTNSDIPGKPPPPYPGRHIGMAGAAPLIPPRVPLREKPPPPPPPGEQEVPSHLPSHNGAPQAPPTHLTANFPQVPGSSSSSPSPSSPGLNFTGVPLIPVSTVDTTGGGVSPNLPGPQVPSSAPPSETDETDTDTSSHASSKLSAPKNNDKPHRCMSPLPERRSDARERDRLRCDTKVRMYSPQAFKFYMEQHVENVLKSHSQRLNRRIQLEKEMAKVNLSEEAARQMRKMLHQKESNYIRLKRAKMESSMFEKIKPLGVGAFGEVFLVRKKDVGSLYAMKTLKKSSVIKRNQVAHVKAERDILAEADNEWVVKLYYSFQDKDHLYFVMDYVPGGDLMGLLIRREILEESLAQFYIAELVLAIESVHRMGFIHRDIKPDNILIDKDGHIKLTDFGLCTGFRWTHNSKYYQKDGSHARQDSMEVSNNCQFDDQCRCEILKPLEQRRQREEKRCLAHSLVGTPNYIAPEVLRREGYTKACDWWSVGVILYEMVIGQPPFYANTPAETQYKVINWEKTLVIDSSCDISMETADLILKLLRGPESRLGHNGAQEVKEHAFFRGINFEGLRRQPAPLKPTICYPTDTSNFDPVDPDKLRTNDSEGSKKVDSKLENGKHPEHAFYEFTFRRFFDDGGHPCSMPTNPDPESNSPVYV